mmetsp:Transcript_50340/g.116207  ORF Transcript_50340/g.116207 Transcript_50340/m.116207 type:complete len:238 (-) Transcript_50340:159-872(-)
MRRVEQLADPLIDPRHVRLLVLVAEGAHGRIVLRLPLLERRWVEAQHGILMQELLVEGLQRDAERGVAILGAVIVLVEVHLLPRGAHLLLELRSLARVLLELAHDGGGDVVQVCLRCTPLAHQVVPQALEQAVHLLVKVCAERRQLRVRVRAVASLGNFPLVLADGAQEPRAVRGEHTHVVHLILEPLLQQRREPHHTHVRGMALFAVLARALDRCSALHVHLVHGAAKESAKAAHD